LMVLHLEWPDIERLRKTAGAHAPCFPDVSAVITGPPREQPRAHGIGTLRLGDWWSGSTAYGRSRPRLPSPHPRWRDHRRSGRPACGLLCFSQSSARRRARDDRKEGVSMTRGGIHLGRMLGPAALTCLVASASVLAAPGDPFGGDDTGCVPSTKTG